MCNYYSCDDIDFYNPQSYVSELPANACGWYNGLIEHVSFDLSYHGENLFTDPPNIKTECGSFRVCF